MSADDRDDADHADDTADSQIDGYRELIDDHAHTGREGDDQ